MKNFRRKRGLGILIFLAVFAAGAAAVMLLWNWLVPTIIGWQAIGYWQAAGILLMCKLLFGGTVRMARGFGRPHPHRGFTPADRMRMHDDVRNMSADERREYIRSHMFGGQPCPDGDGTKK